MTDLDRIRSIAEQRAGYGIGLTEDVVEDFRLLLDCLAHATGVAAEFVVNREEWREIRDACRYTVPPKRCRACGGEGWAYPIASNGHARIMRTPCEACGGDITTGKTGTGYQETDT